MKAKCPNTGKFMDKYNTDNAHCTQCGTKCAPATSRWGVKGWQHPDSGEVTLSPTEVKELNEQEAARYDRAWEGMSSSACGNGRHGYPKDWPGAYASSLKKQIFNEVGRKRGRDVIQAMRYRRFLM